MVHAVIVFFFYYLSYLNVYLKYVFAFSEGRAGLSNKMCTDMLFFFCYLFLCFGLLSLAERTGHRHLYYTFFYHIFSFLFRSCVLQRNHPPSLRRERCHFSPPYQRTLFLSILISPCICTVFEESFVYVFAIKNKNAM